MATKEDRSEETRHETEVMRDVVAALDTVEDNEALARVLRYVGAVFGFDVEF
jgi:hypothetical protein